MAMMKIYASFPHGMHASGWFPQVRNFAFVGTV